MNTQIQIKNITHTEKTSARTGKLFTSCRITSVGKDGNDVILSGFGSNITKTWNIGDKVDVDVEKTPSGYYNFKENSQSKPSPNPLFAYFGDVNKKLDEILNIIKPIKPLNTDVKDEDIPDFLK